MAEIAAPWLADGAEGSTRLSPAEQHALIPAYVTCRGELDELEQRGVANAITWALGRRRKKVLNDPFLCRLHRRMFGEVWRWAGEYRTTRLNLGVAPWEVRPELSKLLADAATWLEYKAYSADEIAVRFHHRLVWVHPFPNGNGRLSRLMADLLVTAHGGERFSWGAARLIRGEARARYINALRSADAHDIGPLLTFARS